MDIETNFHDVNHDSLGYVKPYEAAIYKDGITNVVYIMYQGNWIDVTKAKNLPERHKKAIADSVFCGNG